MDQNWLYVVVLSALPFERIDHEDALLVRIILGVISLMCANIGKSWGFYRSCLATGKECHRLEEGHFETIRAYFFCLPIYRSSIAHIVLAGWKFCFCVLEKLIQVQLPQVHSAGADFSSVLSPPHSFLLSSRSLKLRLTFVTFSSHSEPKILSFWNQWEHSLWLKLEEDYICMQSAPLNCSECGLLMFINFSKTCIISWQCDCLFLLQMACPKGICALTTPAYNYTEVCS